MTHPESKGRVRRTSKMPASSCDSSRTFSARPSGTPMNSLASRLGLSRHFGKFLGERKHYPYTVPMEGQWMRPRRLRLGLFAGLLTSLAFAPLRAQYTEYVILNLQAKQPSGITAGPDGAMWFTGELPSAIATITSSQQGFTNVYAYQLPNPTSYPMAITSGPDGALWFTEYGANKIGRITTHGSITEYPIPTANSQPLGIATGSDGALWFTEYGTNRVGRITTSGVVTEFPLANANSNPWTIVSGPDGALWFTESGRIGQITTSGAITEYPANNGSWIAAGPDGALWFTEGRSIGRITTSGAITEYPVPTMDFSNLQGITAGPDGALWFTDNFYNKLGRITTSGTFSYYVSLPPGRGPGVITSGPDGALWLVERLGNAIGRFLPGPPPPTISSLSPNSVTGGSPGFTLTVNGAGFTPAVVVQWNETGTLATTFVSSIQLTAVVPAGLITTPGTADVSVALAGIPSNVVPFTINPGPVITSLTPASATAGAPAFTLTVNGSRFAAGAVVDWNGSPLTTSFVSDTQLTASVPASLIAKVGNASVTVAVGGLTTAGSTFTIVAPPVINSLNPPSATVGGPAFTLTVFGSG